MKSAQGALALYPLDPAGMVSLGDTQLAAGAALGDGELLQSAIESYERALVLDDRRMSWEEFYRFRPDRKLEIRERIERARDLLAKSE